MKLFNSKKRMAKTLCKFLALEMLCLNVLGGELRVAHAETVSGNDASVSVSGNDAGGNEDVSGNDLLPGETVSGNELQGLTVSGNVLPYAASGKFEPKLALSGKTTGTVAVDGDLTDAAWSEAEENEVAFLADFTISNNKTYFKSVWDENTLYVGVDVTDANVVTADNSKLDDVIYNNDGVEIFLDGDRDFADHKTKPGQDAWDVNDFHLFIRHDGVYEVWGGSKGAWTKTEELDGYLDVQTRITDKGFSVEVAVDFAGLGVTPQDGEVLGISVVNNDNDNYTATARKEILWFEGHNAGKPSTWGALGLYETRKPLISTYGSPVVNGNDVKNWDASIWNFNENASLNFANIPGATVKFASLSDYDGFYLAMLIEGAGEKVPYVETIFSGDNKRSGKRNNHDYIIQWEPLAEEGWKQVNTTVGKDAEGNPGTKPAVAKYILGDGSYAYVAKFAWDTLDAVDDSEFPRENFSVMSFSVQTGNDSKAVSGTNTNWTQSNPWGGEPFDAVASIIVHNPDIRLMDSNAAPAGNALYAYSIPQGGTVSGKVNTTDANEGDTLSFALEEGFDTANGTVTVDSSTGEWTYATPNADFVQKDRTGVNFWIIATDTAGAAFRTRIQVNVEPTPTNLTYYVDGDTGNDSNDGLSYATALKTINAAHDKTKPGDTVLIYESEVPYGYYTKEEYDAVPGLYASIRNGAIVISNSGLPEAPITYKAADGQRPVIKGNGIWQTVKIAANYIKFEGITIRGTANEVTYEEAYNAFWAKIAPKDGDEYSSNWDYPCGLFNTNGVGVGPLDGNKVGAAGVTDANVCIPHHVTVSNCLAEYIPANGFGGDTCDYVTFENCTSTNNGWWEMYGSSGFGFGLNVDIDDNTTDYKLIIRNNISAGNRHFIPWKSGTVRLSDGNGIIIDTLDEHANNYQGKILIANNLVYENGGSGIHAFRADSEIDIVNNTIFNNGSVPELGWGELFANDAQNVRMYNNIAYSRTGNAENPAAKEYDNNIFYNYKSGTILPATANKIGVDPKFVGVTAVVHMPEGFNPDTDYPAAWYEVKNANSDIMPNQWSCAANAKAAGWYPGVNYDVTTYGYDFTLAADSPARGAADANWQAIAGGAEYENAIGIFGEVGAKLNEQSENPPVDPEEKPPVDPEEKPPVDPEEKPPVDPEEKPPVDPEEKPPVDPEEKPPVDPEEKPPVDPEEKPPVDSEGNGGSNESAPGAQQQTAPKTGDAVSDMMILGMVIMAIAGCVLCIGLVNRRKKRNS